ncbi:MAG TPA: tetratricopeptide repeat protein, partial [Nitrososphaeraceae archaeon]|nr:tetratricopeptide repeat protein [Nitrososphaeraceae archaeon]
FDPNNTKVYYDKGNTLFNLGRYHEALESFTQAFKGNGGSYYDVILEKGLDLYKQNKLNESLSYFDKMIELDQNNSEVYYAKGNTMLRMGNNTEALNQYDIATSLSFIDPTFYVQKGNALLNIGNYTDAVKEYSKSIRLDPFNSSSYIHKGSAFVKLADTYQNMSDQLPYFKKALREFDKAIENNQSSQSNAKAFYSKFDVLFKMEKYQEALEAIIQALELDRSTYSPILIQKGLDLYKQNKLNESLSYFDSLIKEDPKNANAYFAKGNVLFRIGNNTEALKLYEEAIKLDPVNAPSFIYRGNPWSNFEFNNTTKNQSANFGK